MIQMIDIQANTQSWTLPETQVSTIEAAFQEFTERRDIGILLINQHVGLSSIMDGQSYPVEFLLFRLRRRYGLLWTSTNKHSPHYLKYPLKTFHMVNHSFSWCQFMALISFSHRSRKGLSTQACPETVRRVIIQKQSHTWF